MGAIFRVVLWGMTVGPVSGILHILVTEIQYSERVIVYYYSCLQLCKFDTATIFQILGIPLLIYLINFQKLGASAVPLLKFWRF